MSMQISTTKIVQTDQKTQHAKPCPSRLSIKTETVNMRMKTHKVQTEELGKLQAHSGLTVLPYLNEIGG
ncbi:MAG: hypothetical protein CL862_09250 [Cyanobium sp. NAT70]|nr:hypothetical protein [Cyanobium sp. NAT70]